MFLDPPTGVLLRGHMGVTNGLPLTIFASYTVGISRTGGTVTEDYNLFFGDAVTGTGTMTHGVHSFTGNPAFVNPGADDYHLTTGSAAIDQDIDAGVYTDLDGNPRPWPAGGSFGIGAYEAQDVPGDLAIKSVTPDNVGPGQAITYTWSLGHGGDVITDTAAIRHTFPLTNILMTYTVMLTASNTCSAQAADPRQITVQPFSIYLPLVIRQ